MSNKNYAFVNINRVESEHQLIITRPKLHILIDNEKMGLIYPNGNVLIPVVSGYHTIYVQHLGRRSNVQKLHLQPGEIIYMTCSASVILFKKEINLYFDHKNPLPIDTEYAFVRLKRIKNSIFSKFPISVIVNNNKINSIDNNQELLLPITPDLNSIYVTSYPFNMYGNGNIHSEILQLNLEPGDVIEMHCGFAKKPFRLGNKPYVFLKFVDSLSTETSKTEPLVDHMELVTIPSDEIYTKTEYVETIELAPGVKIRRKVTRKISQTIEIEWSQNLGGKLQVGWQDLVLASIEAKIERKYIFVDEQSKILEDEISVDGNFSSRYEIIWEDIWRKGFVDLSTINLTKRIPFQYLESTKLRVIPVDENNK